MFRLSATVAATLLLTSCVAHSGPFADTKQYANWTPYGTDFYRQLLSGRVWIYSDRLNLQDSGLPQARIFRADGKLGSCTVYRRNGRLQWSDYESREWDIVWGQHGATIQYKSPSPAYTRMFYDPETGSAATESYRDTTKGKRIWERGHVGWLQDDWPRALVDVCPDIPLPSGMAINEKQTSLDFGELKRQDPEAPVRNFAGSEMTAPGRTGLAASGLAPTTTKEEVWTFLNAEEGNILLSPAGTGRVFVRGSRRDHELWYLTRSGKLETKGRTLRESTDVKGEWLDLLDWKGKIRARYPMGYPFPYLPTGYRHAAFQLTDRLIEAGEPVVLPWIDPEWKDFTFRADGMARARRANGGPDRLAPWRWTKGRLWVQIGDNRKAPGWEEAYERLGMEKPKLWTPADGQRIGPLAPQPSQASTAPATSGIGKCAGAYTGTATWMLGADGKRVWDTSGCRRR